MSLSALNSPPLIVAGGVGSYLVLPWFEKAIDDGSIITWNVCKAANACAYLIDFVAVSVPGRLDGTAQARNDKDKKKKKDGAERESSKEMEPISTGRNGRTLVAPSGWAFVIWAPIFIGELISVSSQLFVPPFAPVVPVLKQLTAPYVVANSFQSLWTAAFRPKYVGWKKFVSAGLLGGTAYSLSKAHAVIAAAQLPFGKYVLFGLPISLHFGWVTAATLVNFNGAIATYCDDVSSKAVAAVGHLSVIAAATLGVVVTVMRGAPVYGGVISWALLAVADGMTKRIHQTRDEDPKRMGVYGCRVQRRLSQVGAAVSALASLYATVSMHITKGKSQ